MVRATPRHTRTDTLLPYPTLCRCNGNDQPPDMPMSAHCCRDHAPAVTADPLYRRVLWIALAINAGMFLTEVVAGTLAGTVALQADALDFLADAANYGISPCVLGKIGRAHV